MNENICREIRQDDIVRVELWPASQCAIPVPQSVTIQSLVENNLFTGSPALSLALSVSEEVMLSDLPTLKVSNARQQAGNIYTHDFSLPLKLDRVAVEQAVDTLLGRDFHVVSVRADGRRDLSYAVHNGSSLDIDQTHSAASVTTAKVRILSMSHLIALSSS